MVAPAIEVEGLETGKGQGVIDSWKVMSGRNHLGDVNRIGTGRLREQRGTRFGPILCRYLASRPQQDANH